MLRLRGSKLSVTWRGPRTTQKRNRTESRSSTEGQADYPSVLIRRIAGYSQLWLAKYNPPPLPRAFFFFHLMACLPYRVCISSSGCIVGADVLVQVPVDADDAVRSFQDSLADVEGEVVRIVVAFYEVVFGGAALVLGVFLGSNGDVGSEIEKGASFCRDGRAGSGRGGLLIGGKGGSEEGCR